MNIWGLSDLHLSFARPKPMEVFGDHWRDHAARVEAAWRERVAPDDVVCLPGDLSWAMRLPEVQGELEWLARLPGRKVLVKGNHDYWWSSAARLRAALPAGIYALQNDALALDGVAFAGARGWVDPSLTFGSLLCALPGEEPEGRLHGIRGGPEDAKIYRRELGRLEASLRRLDPAAGLRVALLHFPPTSPALEETPVTRLLERYRVRVAVFGHLHGTGRERFANPFGCRGGVTYHLVSADFVNFAPWKVAATSLEEARPCRRSPP
ncbi:MAG: metallophosphoesterase [Deferrisomatales bacterium]